jgi:hypothetical protein
MAMMKLEAGKYNKTRDGRMAFVAGINDQATGSDVCVGWVDRGPRSWTIDGFHFADMVPHEFDPVRP